MEVKLGQVYRFSFNITSPYAKLGYVNPADYTGTYDPTGYRHIPGGYDPTIFTYKGEYNPNLYNYRGWFNPNQYNYKGEYNPANPVPGGIVLGDFYKISASGTFLTIAVAAGSYIVATKNSPAVAADWTFLANSPDISVTPSNVVAGDFYKVTEDGEFFDVTVTANTFIKAKVNNPTQLSHWDVNIAVSPEIESFPNGVLRNDFYRVSVTGLFYDVEVEAGTFLVANVDNPSIKTDWTIQQYSPDLTLSPYGVQKNDVYKVTKAGTFYGVAVAAGSFLVANQDNPTTNAHWGRRTTSPDIADAPNDVTIGKEYRVTEAGTFRNLTVAVGDILVALDTNPSSDGDWERVPNGVVKASAYYTGHGFFRVLKHIAYYDLSEDDITAIKDTVPSIDITATTSPYFENSFYKLEDVYTQAIKYVPENAIKGQPVVDIAEYSKVMLAVNLGVIAEPDSISSIKNYLDRYLRAVYGLESVTEVMVFDTAWMTNDDYKTLVAQRVGVKNAINLYSENLKLVAEKRQLLERVLALEDIIVKLSASEVV